MERRRRYDPHNSAEKAKRESAHEEKQGSLFPGPDKEQAYMILSILIYLMVFVNKVNIIIV